jgi:hypothetical protein
MVQPTIGEAALKTILCACIYEGKSISKLQMDIELKQKSTDLKNTFISQHISLYIEALVPLFHKPLKTSSIKFFGLLLEPATQ